MEKKTKEHQIPSKPHMYVSRSDIVKLMLHMLTQFPAKVG